MATRAGTATGELVSRPVATDIDHILSVRGADRAERLLSSPNLPKIVPRLPPEELFFTLKEMDEEGVPAVLAHAAAEQLQFVLDLELWHRDRLRPERVTTWLSQMVAAGPPAVRRWLTQVDPETWVLLFCAVARVRVADPETDPFQEDTGRAPFTLDGTYYVSAREEVEPALREILSTAREEDPRLYFRVVEAVPRDPDPELEERGFEAKQRRLAHRGFPSWEEAYEVYARLSPLSIESLPVREEGAAEEAEEGPVAPRYPVAAASPASGFFSRALGRVAPESLEALRGELAYLTNKVVVADGLDASDLDSYDRALRKVAGYVSVGLELFAGPDEVNGASLLQRHWVQHFFRAGWTRVRQTQSKARHFLDKSWPTGKMERLLFLDPPLPEILDGLLRRHPLWYAGEGELPALREFSTLSEVERAERSVEKAEFLGTFLLSVIDFRLQDVQEAAVRLDSENLRSSTVFLTALLNAALDRGFRFAPVERQTAGTGLSKLWTSDLPPRRVRPELLQAALQWSRAMIPASPQNEAFLEEFIDDSLELLEEEFGHLAPEEVPDPRFTKGLWIL